jgi:hypothetical protein
MLIIKGIKKGKKIELLEDININDGEEILISVEIIEKKSEEKIRPSGLCEGEFIVPDDFDASLPEEILRQFEGE